MSNGTQKKIIAHPLGRKEGEEENPRKKKISVLHEVLATSDKFLVRRKRISAKNIHAP